MKAAAAKNPSALSRARVAGGGVGAAVLGAAPHVLHHVGPLAGAALLGGIGGTLLFGVLGFVLAIPLLRRMRRRTGSWAAPGAALAFFVALFTLSTVFVGPALSSDPEGKSAPVPARTVPDAEHDAHHP